jgi:hypothetical protein
MLTRLTYKGYKNFTITAAAVSIAYRWQPSAAYDIDPLVGSTTVVGFTELTAFYNYYRVLRSRNVVRVANASSVPATVVMLPLNSDPGASPSIATQQSWLNNPYSKIKVVPAAGGPVVSVSGSMSTEKIFGSKMVYFDDNFASLVNTIPTNNWYWAASVQVATAPGSTINFYVENDIYIDVEFYSRKALLN